VLLRRSDEVWTPSRTGSVPCRSVESWNEGLPVSTMAGDVRSREQMHKIVQDTVERCGGLDIVVANAGDARAPV
jgi:NAD(P)-dependent dehydrogenase (short-subunit alcohol dehydrogenase family)